jgi:hypothetical protein
MPLELCRKLHGLTINQALKNGIIDELGDDDVNFIFQSETNPEIYFAIVQGYPIQCSEQLMQYPLEEIESIIGKLSFFRYTKDDEEYFRLGRPNGIKLGKAVFTLKVDEPNEKDPNSHALLSFEPTNKPPTNPEKGIVYYDSTLNMLRCFDGNAWQNCW